VRPLACFGWERVWTLGAWCEQRQDFRSFRLDCIAALDVLEERFSDESGRALTDFLRAAREQQRN
jgi:predicted DNA-binding transcriptional regulator YafY